MAPTFSAFGGIDFSGAREPLSNLWTALGREQGGRLEIVELRPHAFRADLAGHVMEGWRTALSPSAEAVLWGVDFPFGLPLEVSQRIGPKLAWDRVVAWVADRPPEEVRELAGDAVRATRAADTASALPPLDLRLYKQTVEGLRWLHDLRENGRVRICPQDAGAVAPVTLIEVYPAATARELGLPRRRAPARPGEVRARAAALRTFVDFAEPACEATAVTLEDAWDATIACLTAYLCRDDLEQPARTADAPRERIVQEGWIYRPPAALV